MPKRVWEWLGNPETFISAIVFAFTAVVFLLPLFIGYSVGSGEGAKRGESEYVRERFCEGWDAARAFDPLDDADRMAEVLKRTHTLGDPQKTCWHPERVRASNATPDDVWCFPASGAPVGATCVRPK